MSGSHTPYSLEAALATSMRGRAVEQLETAVLAPRELPSITWVMAAILKCFKGHELFRYSKGAQMQASSDGAVDLICICQFPWVD